MEPRSPISTLAKGKDSPMNMGTATVSSLPERARHLSPFVCPQCRGSLIRTWRRPVDRMTTLVVPVHRYRCEVFSCQWEGNFRVDRGAGDANGKATHDGTSTGMSTLILLEVVIAVVAIVLIVAVSTSDSWSFHNTSMNSSTGL
jgi:hypothetical protein